MVNGKVQMGTVARFKSWYKNQLLKKKVLIIYIPLIVIPLLLLGYTSNNIFTKAMIEKTIKNVLGDSSLTITHINFMITNAESCANMLTVELNRIISQQRDNENDQALDLHLRNQIQGQLSFALLLFRDIESAAFIDTRANIYFTDSKLQEDFGEAMNSELLKKIEDTNGINVWFPMQTRRYLTVDDGTPVLTLGKKIVNISTGEKLGLLILNVKESSFSSIYKGLGLISDRSYFIINQDGIVVSSQDSKDILKPVANEELKQLLLSGDNLADITKVNGEKALITSMPFKNLQWKLVSRIPLSDLLKDTRKNTIIITVIGLICVAFALLGVGILSKAVANPIVKLTKNMSKIKQGNLDIYCEVESDDEVGLLASGFNTMVERIKVLLENIKLEQKKKREYELALIQAQIKPHFLYNTLDLVYVLCSMKREREAMAATKSLADFYRAALSKGKEIITIGEELKNAGDYLNIQRMRYSDVFDYEINVEENILRYKILKLTIQPLVENSVYHGLKMKGEFGRIIINGYKEDDSIILKVIDDGVGIREEKLQGIFQENGSKTGAQASFGLISVRERMKLYYGENCGIRIKSKVGSGTEVTITIPVSFEGVDQ